MNRIEFDRFEVDLDLYELRRDGVVVPLGPRPLDVLIYLVQHRDRVVDRDSLRRDVWQATQLSNATIPTCMMEIRRALKDQASSPRFIQSVRARGYRFIGDAKCSGRKTKRGSRISADLEFVGRRDEIGALANAAQSIKVGGQGQVFLIGGEAGIGKSRLLREVDRSLVGSFRSFSTKAPPINGTPPFWPWIQLLNAAFKEGDHDNRDLANAVQPLSAIFPEISSPLLGETNEIELKDRFGIFTQWTKAIRSIALRRPTVLAVEDIHRADPDSQSLLYWICDALVDDPVLLLVTHRHYPITDHAAAILSEISDMPHTSRLELGPLATDEIALLLDPSGTSPDETSRSLRKSSGGNAFYVTHLIRSLDYMTAPESLGLPSAALPLNGREIVARQLSDLSETARSFLSAASTLGDHFSLDVLSKMLRLKPNDIEMELKPAEQAWLIERDRTGYRFRHTLLRDALYQLLDPGSRRNFHLAAAQELREHVDWRSSATQIADHLAEALPHGSFADATAYAMVAGREAASKFAFSRAQSYFERALGILDASPSGTPEARYEVLVELAGAALYETDREIARGFLLEAAEIARKIDAPKKLARCALDMSPDFLSIEVGTYDQTLVSLLSEAISTLSNNELSLRAQCLARLSQALHWRKSPSHDEKMAIESIELAAKSGDDTAKIAAHTARAESMNGPHQAGERVALLREIESPLCRSAETPAHLLQKTRLISALMELGEMREVEIINEQYRTMAEGTGLAQYMWMPIAHDCMLATMRGELDRADTLATEYQEIAGTHPDANVVQTFAMQSALREFERDQAVEILPLAREMSQSQKSVLGWQAAIVYLQCDAGHLDDARSSLHAFSEVDIAAALTDVGGGLSIAMLAEVAVQLRETKYIEILWDHLRPIENRFASGGYGMLYLGSFARYAGLVAHALGETPTAVRLLNVAIESESRVRAHSWHAYANLDLIRIELESGLNPDLAVTRLDEVRKVAALRHLPHVERKAHEIFTDIN
jgi:DNA-binding winged helix-turn-helix (wHTH) protein